MRVTTLNNETSVAEIADRLYENLTPESRKVAEAALLKANPELAKSGALRPGAIIRVPDVPALKLKPARTEDDPVGQTREVLKGALNSYQRLLAERLKAEQEELETQAELLKELLRKGEISRDLHAIIEGLKGTLESRIEENKVKGRYLPEALHRALKDLAE